MNLNRKTLAVTLLRTVPVWLFIFIVGVFSLLGDNFLTEQNFANIAKQAAPVAILGIGMTFVLLTAGIDLSVGAVMYASTVAFGFYTPDLPIAIVLLIATTTGAALGAVNGGLIVSLRVPPFIVTLSSMFIIRGVCKWLTETKPVRVSEPITELGREGVLGVSWSILILTAVCVVSWLFLRGTPSGRQMYAIGGNLEAARKSAINVNRTLWIAYVLCGACAGVAGFVAVSHESVAQTYFGQGKEFEAIAAAVLGGASLFGGRGHALSAVFGALLFYTITAGLNSVNPNEFLYPMVVATVIFVAVALDSLRNRIVEKLNRPHIVRRPLTLRCKTNAPAVSSVSGN